MKLSFEETLTEVWRQSLVENATAVELDGSRYPVRRTPRRRLRQVDFVFDGNEIRGLEQNPQTKSRWAQMARPPLATLPTVRPSAAAPAPTLPASQNLKLLVGLDASSL
jgi:hypothetical protein